MKKRFAAIILALALCMGLAVPAFAAEDRKTEVLRAAPSFTDVPAGEWYADPVAWALERDITNGTDETHFSPNQNCTHAQILTFLYRADRGEGKAAAEDMDLAVKWAREKGIIDDSFDGSEPCTRGSAVIYIWKAFGEIGADGAEVDWTDVPDDETLFMAINFAWACGITNGVDNGDGTYSFYTNQVCTRAHIVTFLYRAYPEGAR